MPMGFGLMLTYEFLMNAYGWDTFIFHAPRVDFISANREGLASLVGYFSLELIGIGIGNFIYRQLLSEDQIECLKQNKPIPDKPK